MFNPSDIPISQVPGYQDHQFVGVRRNSKGDVEFCIPEGFDDFPIDDKEQVNKLFFDIYKLIRTYAKNIARRYNIRDVEGAMWGSGKLEYVDEHGENVEIYSRISMIEDVIDAYNELKIFELVRHQRKTNYVQYDKIDKYLHKAIYINGDIPFVDEMMLSGNYVIYDISDIVRLYCFIYVELKKAMGEYGAIGYEIKSYAEVFKGQHLSNESGLFGEKNHIETVEDLKRLLYEIDATVEMKGEDYLYFFGAIESFLFGRNLDSDSNIMWGITRFSAIWESICLEFLVRLKGINNVKYSGCLYKGEKIISDDFDASCFIITTNTYSKKMIPDLVLMIGRTARFDEVFDVRIAGVKYKFKLLKNNKEFRNIMTKMKNYINKNFRFRINSTNDNYFECVIPDARFYSSLRTMFEVDIAREFAKMGKEKRDFMVIDFKYVNGNIYKDDKLTMKAKSDISKQFVYGLAIRINNDDIEIESQFITPRYYPDDKKGDVLLKFIKNEELNIELVQRKITVFEMDFMKVADEYIMNYGDVYD